VDVIVVENGSGDGSREKLTAAIAGLPISARLLAQDRNRGFAGGVLAVWPEATGDLVCLLNNDATLHPDCLTRLVDGLRGRTDLGAVWPFEAPPAWREKLQLPEPAHVAAMRNGTSSVIGTNIWLPLLADYRQCFTASGVCLLFPRAEVDIPFPAEYFAYYEDIYLGWRLRLRGLGAERVPEAVIYHVGSGTSREQPELRGVLAFHAEKNRLANLTIFYAAPTLVRILPLLALDEMKKLVVALVRLLTGRGGFDYLMTYARARLWLVRRIKWILGTRRRMQAERRVNDRDIVRLLSGRLSMQKGVGATILNRFSLGYCRAVGLRTVEFTPRPDTVRPG